MRSFGRTWFDLMEWLALPSTLLRIRRESAADATEGLLFLRNRHAGRRISGPMRSIMNALTRRAAMR